MKTALSSESLNSAMAAVTDYLLPDLPLFPFFGSLLGYTRNGSLIEGDDDLDFFIDRRRFDELVGKISNSRSFEILIYDLRSPFILFRATAVPEVPIAVHGYRTETHSIVDRWNFSGLPHFGLLSLRVPNALVFPLEYRSDLALWMPCHSEALCRFLYGKKWRTPQTKFVDYKAVAVLGTPIRLYGKAARLSQIIINNLKKFAPNRSVKA